jgi:hypothetical protein
LFLNRSSRCASGSAKDGYGAEGWSMGEFFWAFEAEIFDFKEITHAPKGIFSNTYEDSRDEEGTRY